MKVPTPVRRSPKALPCRAGLGLLVLFLVCVLSATAKPPVPESRLVLEDLGFEMPSQHLISTGASLISVNFVDRDHLVVSFAVRRLMKRLPDDPPEDEDRMVTALLLELPSGKVLARTEWRVHDPAQYLWNLGNGTLLLRIRNTISTLAPMANLPSGNPFLQHPFLHSDRPIAALLLSPEADFLTLETANPPPPTRYSSTVAGHPMAAFDAATGAVTVAEPKPDPAPIQINFYRLSPSTTSPGAMVPRVAGVLRTASPVYLPADAAGFLDVLDQGNNSWTFDFDVYTGKAVQLGVFDSTCSPEATLVSRGEFIALACHGGSERQMVAAFNLRGDEMWVQNLYTAYTAPRFLSAPYGGRFAFSRLTVPSGVPSTLDLSQEIATNQLVTVFQNDSGKELLRLDCSPIQRSAENISLAPDGMSLALVRYGAIEVYRLPPLSAQDKSSIQLTEASSPERNESLVKLPQHRHVDPPPAPAAFADTPSRSSSGTAQGTPPQSTQTASPPAAQQGDEQPRKPPTLYTLPADKPSTAEDPPSSPPP